MSSMLIMEDSFSLRLWRNMLTNTGELAARTALWALSTPSAVLIVTSVWMLSSSMRERHRRVVRLVIVCIITSLGHIEQASAPYVLIKILNYFRSNNKVFGNEINHKRHNCFDDNLKNEQIDSNWFKEKIIKVEQRIWCPYIQSRNFQVNELYINNKTAVERRINRPYKVFAGPEKSLMNWIKQTIIKINSKTNKELIHHFNEF